MPNDYPAPVVHFVYTLLRARDWQGRPEFTQVCDWRRAGGKGVLALVGIGGAGKTAIADRFVRSLPGVTESELHQPPDTTLPVPEGLFVFSFYDAPNPEHFVDALYNWLVTEFQVADCRRVTDAGVRLHASSSLVEVRQRIDEAREELTRCRALRQRIQDPKVCQTDDVLDRLNGGELTRYPYMLVPSAPLGPVPQHANAQSADRSVPMPAKKHVFISYCHDNATEVAQLRNDLLATSEPVWWDQDILPGEDWKRAIRQAMRDSYAVLLCLSQEAAARTRSGIFPEALDAITAYREYAPGSIYLIPVRLSDCIVPSIEIDDVRTLDRLQHVDLFPAAQRAAGLQRLIAAIRATPDHP